MRENSETQNDRLILFECVTGSHLYGTATAESDHDYSGVFAPSLVEHLGLQNAPTEWSRSVKVSEGPRNTSDDVDRKYFSLRRFIQLAAEGQPGQLEMLFAPPHAVSTTTEVWWQLIDHRELFLSRKGIAPFLGFAKAQAHKAVIKGENLRHIRALLQSTGKVTSSSTRIRDLLEIAKAPTLTEVGHAVLCGQLVKLVANQQAPALVEVAGRQWDINITLKLFTENLGRLLETYGTRSQAAAEDTYDFKSILHAVRLLGEAEEYLSTGHITLPRPAEEVGLLMRIRRKEWPGEGDDVFAFIDQRITHIRQVAEPRSPLPPEPDWRCLRDLCVELHLQTLGLKPVLRGPEGA